MAARPDNVDGVDRDVLAGIRDLYAAADPMPADLVTRVQFALELEDVEVEVLRLAQEPVGAVRGEPDGEQSRTITFDSPSVTIMIALSTEDDDATIRMDGWLAPAAAFTVEVRSAAGTTVLTADDDGRFVVDRLAHGMVQLVVRVPAGHDPEVPPVVVTPAIVV